MFCRLRQQKTKEKTTDIFRCFLALPVAIGNRFARDDEINTYSFDSFYCLLSLAIGFCLSKA
jgi:hypothetical protein